MPLKGHVSLHIHLVYKTDRADMHPGVFHHTCVHNRILLLEHEKQQAQATSYLWPAYWVYGTVWVLPRSFEETYPGVSIYHYHLPNAMPPTSRDVFTLACRRSYTQEIDFGSTPSKHREVLNWLGFDGAHWAVISDDTFIK